MIVYSATKREFLADVFEHDIQDVVLEAFTTRTGKKVGPSEISSWRESLTYMAKVLNDEDIPDDSGVAIEYGIPQSMKRIDFILSGKDHNKKTHVVIVELKQWSRARRTDKDAIVVTHYSGGQQEANHPSYQAWSYAALLNGFNEAVYSRELLLQPCAYLHNYTPDGDITHECYRHYLERAPVFLKGEAERNKLRAFIKQYVKHGDNAEAIYQIENGRIRPSKMLIDSLAGMINGNEEFVLIDDQKIVHENALAIAKQASDRVKTVMIVEGGPGTGKSVVAINLLVALSKVGLVCRYVSKNAAPRAVYESRLTGIRRKTEISNLFSGSGVFTDTEPNAFDVLIVDEAHRLNQKSGLYGNLGDNQIKEIISAAKSVIFFVDDDQRVTLRDIGRVEEIEGWAAKLNAKASKGKLESQFRCSGSEGYLAWLDNALEIRPTANDTFDVREFDFRVLDTPQELRALIAEKNRLNNKARMVAGYCWNWISKRRPSEYDVMIPEHGFKMRWNLASDGSLWIIAQSSIDEIGCIHTSQGLEVDYIGVIVGPDLVVRNGKVITRPEHRARSDKSLSGYKKLLEEKDKNISARVDTLIKNTYRTLMTRGMKGCYVYCTDRDTAEYFRSRLRGTKDSARPPQVSEPIRVVHQPQKIEVVVPFERVARKNAKPYVDAVPLIDLKFAAGAFSEPQFDSSDHNEWAVLPSEFRPQEGLFVAQVVGESMNRRIPNGAWCLFRLNPVGTREGKVVVAEHRSIHDSETGGSYTVKVYHSKKLVDRTGSWRHVQIRLRPDSDNHRFRELVFESESAGSVRIVAELIAVL